MVRGDVATCGPALQQHCCNSCRTRAPRQRCPSPDALAASYCPSPPLRAAPVASETDRTTHQSQRPAPVASKNVALDDGQQRPGPALDEHGAFRRLVPPPADASRLPTHSAADARAAHLDSMAGYTHRMHELASTQKVVEDTVNVEKGTGLRKLALLRDAAQKFDVTEEPPVVAEWDFEALVRSMGLSESDMTADDCHAVWRAIAGRGEAYDRDGLLSWCRDPPVLKDGATDDEAPASPASPGAE